MTKAVSPILHSQSTYTDGTNWGNPQKSRKLAEPPYKLHLKKLI